MGLNIGFDMRCDIGVEEGGSGMPLELLGVGLGKPRGPVLVTGGRRGAAGGDTGGDSSLLSLFSSLVSLSSLVASCSRESLLGKPGAAEAYQSLAHSIESSR